MAAGSARANSDRASRSRLAARAGPQQVHPPRAPDQPEVLLTLSPGQYQQLGIDLEALRKSLPAESNTQAIIEAVHRQAEAGRFSSDE